MRARSHAARCLVAGPLLAVPRVPLVQRFHLHQWQLGPGRTRPSMTCRAFSSSRDYPQIVEVVSDVPSPKEEHGSIESNWISDPHGYLNSVDKHGINAVINRIYSKYGVEIAVVLLDACAVAPRGFLESLFNAWGIGSKEVNNGILVAVIMGKERIEIVTGDGLDTNNDIGVLDKFWLEDMREMTMEPQIHEGKIGTGLKLGLQQIEQQLRNWPDDRSFAVPLEAGRSSGTFGGGSARLVSWPGGHSWPERATFFAATGGVVFALGLYFEDLYFQKRCTQCGKFQLERYSEKVRRMTCVPWEAGVSVDHAVCEACGFHSKAERIVPAAHKFREKRERLKEPTKLEDGLVRITSTCRICGFSEVTELIIPKHTGRKQAGI